MNILFTICGRAGSKGMAGKNVSDFLEVPLVHYTIAAISLYIETLSAADIVKVAVNTDSDVLIRIVQSQKQVPVFVINRDESLSGDAVSKVLVVRDSLVRAEKHFEITFDVVVDLDITSPIRRVSDIDAAVKKKLQNKNSDVVFSVTHARRNPYFNMVKKEGDFFIKAIESEYVSRQQSPEMFDMNASIYAYSPHALKTKDAPLFFNSRADVVVMKDTGILDIDSPEDHELLSVIAKHFINGDSDFRMVYQRTSDIAAEKDRN